MSELSVDAKELNGRPGTQQHLSRKAQVPADFAAVLVGFPEGGDLDLDLRLESVHEGVLLTGTASARVAGQCGRCLDEIGYPLTVDVMQLFVYPDRAESASGETESEDERVIGDGLIVDLEPVLRDLMVSALPFQPVCREDCPGLCPHCGFRMEEDLEHAHEQLDPRWAALADLDLKTDQDLNTDQDN